MIEAFVTDGFDSRQRLVAVSALMPGDQSFQVNPGTGALFRDKTLRDPRQCCCFNERTTIEPAKLRRSREGGNPVSYIAKSLGPRLRGDDDFNTFNCRINNNPVVPAQAGTQSVQVLENTMDWIPVAACPRMIESGAGMTDF